MTYLKENYKSILVYTGIFFVLLMGSGLVKIPVGSVWFYVIKFSIIAGVLGLALSAWRRAKLRNEPPTDYLKLALFVPFTNDFHLHYSFIFLTIILFNKKLLLPWNSPLKPFYLLFIWGFISYIINQFIEINLLSFPLFITTFFLPFIFFSLFYMYVNKINEKEILQFFYNIISVLMLMLIIQTILYWDLHPDLRNGGVANAHLAGAYLSLAVMYFYFKVFNNLTVHKKNIYYIIMIIFGVSLIYLIDAKYIAVGLITSIFITELVFNFQKSKIRYITISIFVVLLSVSLYSTNQKIILSIISNEQNFRVKNIVDEFVESPRGQLIKDGMMLPLEEPRVFLIGSGPGTFLSRIASARWGYENFYTVETDNIYTFFKQIWKKKFARSTWIQDKYLTGFDIKKPYSSSIFAPNGGLISFYFEFGIVGIIILFILFYTLVRNGKNGFNNNQAFALAIFIAIIYLFGNWVEISGFQILSYSLFGIQLSMGK